MTISKYYRISSIMVNKDHHYLINNSIGLIGLIGFIC